MSARFAAFSFVDRITSRTAERIEGLYTVPPAVARFPASLMAEAVGQLAAWRAMSSLDFRVRPVAGIAAETRYQRLARPGDTLLLRADISRCDAEAVAYSGRAEIDGQCAVELVDCIGPMLPMDDFDLPEAVRADFETLCGAGAAAGRFAGVPAPRIELTERVPGQRLGGRLQVPQQEEAPFFGDHFPRRPVYPGTLLLDALAGLAADLAADAAEGHAAEWTPGRVTDVKIRSFTPPGASLDIAAELAEADAQRLRLKVTARAEGRLVASARVELHAEQPA